MGTPEDETMRSTDVRTVTGGWVNGLWVSPVLEGLIPASPHQAAIIHIDDRGGTHGEA